MGFSFVKAAVACAILERTSGLEPSPETSAPWDLNALLPLSLALSLSISLSLDAIGAVCNQFGLRGTDLHLISCEGFVETFY